MVEKSLLGVSAYYSFGSDTYNSITVNLKKDRKQILEDQAELLEAAEAFNKAGERLRIAKNRFETSSKLYYASNKKGNYTQRIRDMHDLLKSSLDSHIMKDRLQAILEEIKFWSDKVTKEDFDDDRKYKVI